MATTTNYGWDTPDDTDLVKDGALAMRDLGQDVDTSLFSIISGKNVGLVHINTTTVSGAASLTVSNVFTSAFDNYVLNWVGNGSHGSATTMLFNISASGSPAPANWARMYLTTGDSYGPTRIFAGSQSSAAIGVGGDALTLFDATVYRPALASPTGLTFLGNGRSSVSADMYSGGANHTSSTAYDGVILSASSGNITGSLRIYGMRNS
jgi:hypothetical protein